MTSAAYTVGRDSIAESVAVDCPVSAFFAAGLSFEGLPGEESRTPHVPSKRALLVFDVGVGRIPDANPKAVAEKQESREDRT